MPRIGWSNFVVWQCSLRQRNFKLFGGKPSEGTSAVLLDAKTSNEITKIRSVLIEKDCLNTAKMFEFMIKKTHDPEERFSKAVKFFSSDYYNTPENFDGSFTVPPSQTPLTSAVTTGKLSPSAPPPINIPPPQYSDTTLLPI